jgi:hypothetical protein
MGTKGKSGNEPALRRIKLRRGEGEGDVTAATVIDPCHSVRSDAFMCPAFFRSRMIPARYSEEQHGRRLWLEALAGRRAGCCRAKMGQVIWKMVMYRV